MDNQRTRLRSHAAVKKHEAPGVKPGICRETSEDGDVVEVEVESNQNRGLPIVRGENKRKRGPRGGGRRIMHSLELHKEGSLILVEENAKASSDEGKTIERYESSSGGEALSPAAAVADENTNVVGTEEPAAMKQENRRESSRLRVKPSKFRESVSASTPKPKGEQKGADEGTSSLEIFLPTSVQNTHGGPPENEIESKLEKLGHPSTGKRQVKFTNRAGASKSTETAGSAPESSSSPKKTYDDNGLKAALAVVKRVMQIKSAEPFNEPVDPVALEIPDYLDVIKNPMDLETIRANLEGGKHYTMVQQVYDDVQLVWSNCRTYNQEGDPIMDILKTAEICFNRHWNAAGLQHCISSTTSSKKMNVEEISNSEATEEVEVGSEQLREEEEDRRRRKSKDSKAVAKLKSLKIVQFDTPDSRAKAKRSAFVDQVMADSKGQQGKVNADEIEAVNEDSSHSNGFADDELRGEEEMLHKTPDRGLSTLKRTLKSHSKGGKHLGMLPDPETKTPSQEKDSASHGSPANKRRTFGTVHHKPECSCVVCVGRRRKLARQEKEDKEERNEHGYSERIRSPPAQGSSHKKKSKVQNSSRHSPVAKAVTASAIAGETEPMEHVHSDHQMDDAGEGEPSTSAATKVEGAQYFSANHELPLRKVSSSLLQMSQVLFGINQGWLAGKPHSLGHQWPAALTKSRMMEAVHSLASSETQSFRGSPVLFPVI